MVRTSGLSAGGAGAAGLRGPITLLFTDVEGSTELHTRLGDDKAREILRDHERLIRHQIHAHGGWEVKALGDGFMVAFTSARAALTCAVSIQAALEEGASTTTDPSVRVRMGLNVGEVTEEQRDLHGAAVAAAARIAAQARGGEILIADVVRQLVGTLPGLRFRDRGPFELKGFPEPFRLHEVLWRQDAPEFRLLGPLDAVVAGRALELGGTKPRALLAMLLVHLNHVVPTDALVEGLWGERTPPSATNTLQSHLSRLRRVLKGAGVEAMPRLVSRPGGYALLGDADQVDIHRFERLVERGRALAASDASAATAVLRQALALWRGPALADFAEYSFARPEAARLEELRLVVLEELVEAELGLGHHAEVVGELEPLVAAHPLRERLWGQLMVALYRSGRQAEALRAYQRVRNTLVEELGIEPGPALRRLEEQILIQSPDLEPAAAFSPPAAVPLATGVAPPWGPSPGEVFVGRERELALFHDALEDARSGRGRLLFVAGDAGMGKSALVRRFTAEAWATGARVCWGRAWEEEGAPPFWPWVEVVRAVVTGDGAAGRSVDPGATDLGQLLPEATSAVESAAPGVLDPVQARFRLFEAVAGCLIRSGEKAALVVVLEDVHGADAPSLQLLRFITRRLSESRVLVVVTHRLATTPDAPLASVLAELTREPIVCRLALEPLQDEEVARFLEATFGSPVSTPVVASVQRRAEGHPFFLTELMRLLRSRGVGDDPAALRVDKLELPEGVQEMITRRLAALSDDATRVLMAASVIGRDFDLALLERVAPLDADRVLDAVEEAVRAHIVVEQTGPPIGFRFAHALIREALYESQSGVRRVRLHQRVADALESGAAGPPSGRLAELAYHRCASVPEGEAEAAVAAATRAGEHAAGQLAYEEAARLYRLALDTLDRYGGDAQAKGELLTALGHAQLHAGGVSSARQSFQAAAAIARARKDPELLAQAALGLGGGFEVRLFDPELVALLEEALAGLPPGHDALRARLQARLAMALYFGDPLGRRVGLSGEALEVARASGDPGVLAYALSARFFALWDPDHADERRAVATETLRLADEQGDREIALDGLTWTIMDLLERGDRAGADTHLARHAQLAEELRHPLHRYYAEMWWATIAALEGCFAEAEEGADRARALGDQLTEGAYPRWAMLRLVAFREQGRLAEVVDDAEEVIARVSAFRPGWRAALALIRGELGEDDVARQILSDMVTEPAEKLPRDANWLCCSSLLAETCARLGEARYAGSLYQELAPYAGRCAVIRFAPACWGAVSHYLGRLAATGRDWQKAERHFEEALTIHLHLRARPWVARTQHDWAQMLLRRDSPGDRQRAGELLSAASATAAALNMTVLHAACKETSRPLAQAGT